MYKESTTLVPADQAVDVFYDPADPAHAVLEQGGPSVAFFFVFILFFGLLPLVAGIWVGVEPLRLRSGRLGSAVVTHPDHPLWQQRVRVVQRDRTQWVIELPDGSRQHIPASWCTRASRD